MKTIIYAVIAVLLTNGACAEVRTKHNNKLITTYDSGETQKPKSDMPGDHFKQNGQNSREDRISDQPLKFQDDNDIDNTKLAKFSFDDKENPNYGLQKSKRFKAGISEDRIKFEDNDGFDNLDDREADINNYNHSKQVIFEDNKPNEDDFPYYDYETENQPVHKPIKFESNDSGLPDDTNNENLKRDTGAGHISFIDDSKQKQESTHKKERKSRRRPDQPQETFIHNSPYPAYPGATKPVSGIPHVNPAYPGYLLPSYPSSSYQLHSPNSIPSYLRPANLPVSTGYGVYPGSRYQGAGDSRPTINPSPYPNLGHDEHPENSRYPNPSNPGSAALGATQIAKPRPGAPYPRPDYPYNQGYGYPQAYSGAPNSLNPSQNQAQYRPPGHPGIHQLGHQSSSGYYRPSRRPKSLPEQAISAVAEALTSIALYDDYKCVPRLLCEVAGGSTTLPPSLLRVTEGLHPLLTLLQVYNGVSSSPLFVFGKAAVTGMTAKGNPAVCRRAYPQCPTDPDKLINYLNNHNGGFFRFFGQPAVPQQQQNLEQFYGYLSGQYGLQQQQQQNYGYPSPYRYGLLPQYPNTNLQKYGIHYNREHNNFKHNDIDKDTDSIEARIQNKPSIHAMEDYNDLSSIEDQDKVSKWLFPEEASTKIGDDLIKFKPERPTRVIKRLIFPDDNSDYRIQTDVPRDYLRKEKQLLFPEENHHQFYSNYYQSIAMVNNDDYVFDHRHNFYIKKPKAMNADDVVYIVRGNGDPNHPEIVQVRPGQSV